MLTSRTIDLSVAIENGVASDPPPLLPAITYRAHHEITADLVGMFPGLSRGQLPDGMG